MRSQSGNHDSEQTSNAIVFARMIIIPLIAFWLAPISVLAQAEDHPLITRYPGSSINKRTHQKFDAYELIVGLTEDGMPQGQTLEGEVTRLFINGPADRSTLEIYKNYADALSQAGMEVIFTCANDECGPAYASSRWNRFNGITTKSGSNCRYIAGKIVNGDDTAYIAIMVGRRRHQIDIVEVKAMQTGMVAVDATALGNSIDKQGFVSVYGIYFDTGKSEVKPASGPALEEIAKLMKSRPGLKLHVVGHTDNVGGFDLNMRLSKLRADAVMAGLVSRYKIAALRLSAHGVGPLAPKASNADEKGRSQNRRVELVAQ